MFNNVLSLTIRAYSNLRAAVDAMALLMAREQKRCTPLPVDHHCRGYRRLDFRTTRRSLQPDLLAGVGIRFARHRSYLAVVAGPIHRELESTQEHVSLIPSRIMFRCSLT